MREGEARVSSGQVPDDQSAPDAHPDPKPPTPIPLWGIVLGWVKVQFLPQVATASYWIIYALKCVYVGVLKLLLVLISKHFATAYHYSAFPPIWGTYLLNVHK